MAKNYLIGIGGTGARVIEAVINLCAAGYGPDELSVFIVDPDAGNGNLTRTKSLITEYKKCRETLKRTDNNPIFKTDIKIPPDEKGFVWEIFSDKGATLSSFINYANMKLNKKDLADFASVLFSQQELDTELNEGFRGHPSIGSVVMSNPDVESYPFKMLFDDLAERKVNDVKVFLVGSVFGGTGAAGFPTFGSKKILKYHPAAKVGENKSKILLGGALVLPYFTFDLDNETSEKMFVTANDFPLATKAALQYYNEKDLGFDEIYFIGDSLGQKVGKFGVGSKKQENLPHYIELVSGLAAFDFYRQNDVKETADKMLFTASRESEKISWDSLPVSRNADSIRKEQGELKRLLTTMTTFAYAYLTFGKRILKTEHKELKDTWYLENFKFNNKDPKDKEKDPRQNPNKDVLDDFEKFLNNFLFWIAAMDDDSGKVNFIDRKILVNGEMEIGKPKLFDPENDVTKNNIAQFLKGENSKNEDFRIFKNKLNGVNLDKKIAIASDKYINIFYEAAAAYSKSNYNVESSYK